MHDEAYVLMPLGKGEANALVSPEDYERLNVKRWAINPRGYVTTSNGRRKNPVQLHRVVMGCEFGDGTIVDHINRNPLDNRRCNLRFVTVAESVANRGSFKDSTSRYRGVSWSESRGRWVASICFNRRRVSLGRYFGEVDAARAAEAARRVHLPISTPDYTLDPVGPCPCTGCREVVI